VVVRISLLRRQQCIIRKQQAFLRRQGIITEKGKKQHIVGWDRISYLLDLSTSKKNEYKWGTENPCENP
jgi:hypothetical protein